MLLVLVQMKCLLDLVSQALAIWGAAVSTVLFLVDISSATTLRSCQILVILSTP
jgi:hypothetical protein